ncbi:MAG: hypothetical protein QGH19_03045 [Candidatus Woesearchaeota archaeon]|jgi:hypothetical protein|nr:hypothetical protein [Candidatus Woesearchaeota archaeon]|tara:strand:+ start:282 stop:530 length:249 start_codon:yes stop_codon:yes gene_type:complete
MQELENFDGITGLFYSLRKPSLKNLRNLEDTIKAKKPRTKLERLYEMLDRFVAEEEYLVAIEVRNFIKKQEKITEAFIQKAD